MLAYEMKRRLAPTVVVSSQRMPAVETWLWRRPFANYLANVASAARNYPGLCLKSTWLTSVRSALSLASMPPLDAAGTAPTTKQVRLRIFFPCDLYVQLVSIGFYFDCVLLEFHAESCQHPEKSGKTVLLFLQSQEKTAKEDKKLFESLFNLLSFEKITLNDLQFRPFRTGKFGLLFEP